MNNYRERISEIFDEIENELSNIIDDCKSGNFSMNEIADELAELKNKVY